MLMFRRFRYFIMFRLKRKKYYLLIYSIIILVLIVIYFIIFISTKNRCIERTLLPGNSSSLKSNPYNLTFVINEPDTCKPDLFVISTVSSSPDHFKYRSTIRRTWGRNFSYNKIKLKTLFFVGLTNNRSVTDAIKMESEKYRDIIQVDFVDSYRNMTYKFAAELQWVHRHCSGVKFILKTDDDAFVHVLKLDRYLRDSKNIDSEKFMCTVVKHAKPFRENGSKWEVTNEEFSNECETYPSYCSGPALIIPKSLTGRILDAISRTEYFWIDDVYITGILAKILKIGHADFGTLAQMFPDDHMNNTRILVKNVTDGNILLVHSRGPNSLNFLPLVWKELNKNNTIYRSCWL